MQPLGEPQAAAAVHDTVVKNSNATNQQHVNFCSSARGVKASAVGAGVLVCSAPFADAQRSRTYPVRLFGMIVESELELEYETNFLVCP